MLPSNPRPRRRTRQDAGRGGRSSLRLLCERAAECRRLSSVVGRLPPHGRRVGSPVVGRTGCRPMAVVVARKPSLRARVAVRRPFDAPRAGFGHRTPPLRRSRCGLRSPFAAPATLGVRVAVTARRLCDARGAGCGHRTAPLRRSGCGLRSPHAASAMLRVRVAVVARRLCDAPRAPSRRMPFHRRGGGVPRAPGRRRARRTARPAPESHRRSAPRDRPQTPSPATFRPTRRNQWGKPAPCARPRRACPTPVLGS